MKRKISLVLIFFFIAGAIFSREIKTPEDRAGLKAELNEIFEGNYAEVEAAALAIVGANIAVPKLALSGVIPVSNPISILIPAGIAFADSDVSKYKDTLSPSERGLFGAFFANSLKALNPVATLAGKKLSALDLKRGEMIIDGNLDVEGTDTVDLLEILTTSDFSEIDVFVTGDLTIRGSRFETPLKFSGKIEVTGKEEGRLDIDTSDIRLNGSSLNLDTLSFTVNMNK